MASETKTRWLDDGSFELRIPYSDPRELIMDILRYGPGMEVVAPASLRTQVMGHLREALSRYPSVNATK